MQYLRAALVLATAITAIKMPNIRQMDGVSMALASTVQHTFSGFKTQVT